MNNAVNQHIATDTENTDAITATLLPDHLRPNFWPQHFGTVPQ
ncbi:hypothetical protein [Rahnella laticis]|nr:hypothetical protein [Rahnella laticis]